jgi:NHL repeat
MDVHALGDTIRLNAQAQFGPDAQGQNLNRRTARVSGITSRGRAPQPQEQRVGVLRNILRAGGFGFAVDSSGSLYMRGENDIERTAADGTRTSIAGSGIAAGSTDGNAADARFNNPSAVTRDSQGNLYIADTGNFTLRKVTPDGTVSTLAGTAGVSGMADGVGSAASFSNPTSLALDSAGTLYVADGNAIRKMTAAGVVTTLAGTHSTTWAKFGRPIGWVRCVRPHLALNSAPVPTENRRSL